MELDLVGSEESGMEVDLVPKKEPESCRWSELEERSKNAEAKCLELEREIELLRRRLEESEREKLALENELKVSKRGNCELGQQIGGTMEVDANMAKDEDKDIVFQLLAENHVLECEKKYAEKKCKDLESLVEQLKKGMVLAGPMQATVENRHIGLCLPDLNFNDATPKEQFSKAELKDGSCPSVCTKKFVDAGILCDSISEGIGDLQAPGTLFVAGSGNGTPYIGTHFIKRGNAWLGSDCQLNESRVRKYLAFEEEGSRSKKLAPSTPGGSRLTSSINNILDSDDEPEFHEKLHSENGQGNENGKCKTDSLLEETRESEKRVRDVTCQSSEEIEDSLEDQVPPRLTPRRRRAHKIVACESESENDDDGGGGGGDDDDDNLPISELFKSRIQKESSNDASRKLHVGQVDLTLPGSKNVCSSFKRKRLRRRLVTNREGKASSTLPNNTTKYCRGVPNTEEIEDDDSEEGSAENEDASLKDFIVDDDCSEQEDVSNGDAGTEPVDASEDSDAHTDNDSQDVSDADVNYPEILSRIRRKKVDKSEWKFEADMLTAFAECPKLCMRAVCALYRQQTSEEKACKESIFQNGRGFSKFDAVSGSTLAHFLLDGDPNADLQKSVEELEVVYHGNGVELCGKLARHYSNQLFEIYKNKEDPYFHPSNTAAEL